MDPNEERARRMDERAQAARDRAERARAHARLAHERAQDAPPVQRARFLREAATHEAAAELQDRAAEGQEAHALAEREIARRHASD